MPHAFPRRKRLIALGSLVWFLVACGETDGERATRVEETPQADGLSFEAARTTPIVQSSTSGAFRVALQLEDPDTLRARLHAWRVRIEDADGEPIEPSRIAFSGGMPQHRHGFQTAPRVTEALSGGWFRIDGVRFHMGGTWTLRVEFVAPAGADVALFEIDVPH